MPDVATTERSAPRPISWFAAQKRPLIVAHIAGLALLVPALWAGDLSPAVLGRILWPGPLYYFVFLFAFMLPQWLVQAVVYSQMWQRGQPSFVDVSEEPFLDPERRCRFVLSLRTHVFVLAILYVNSREREVHWTQPAWLYLALFAMGLLTFCLLATSVSLLPPLLSLSAIVFWTTSLIFGLGHLLYDRT